MRGRIDPHARYRELIAARLDRPLTRIELRALTAHLKRCESCVGVEAEYRAQRSMVRALPPTIPPRDMWARTSASLDREVARAYRTRKWRRRIARGRKSAQPSTALMTAIAAIGVTAALAVIQLAPANMPPPTDALRPTPLAVSPQQLVIVGVGNSDVAVYRTELSQVCPAGEPLDCIETEKYVRTPVGLPSDMRAGNIALSPNGNQLALVGHLVGEDVIAVVQMPVGSLDGKSGDNGDGNEPHTAPPDNASNGGGTKSQKPEPQATNGLAQPTTAPGPDDVNGNQQPSAPPATAVPGLTVLNILDNVQSAGAPPDWAPNGETLAFSAIPDDESRGPDVYIWSPGDNKARAITTDHNSYFASWSGNKIVLSRLTGNGRPRTWVIDPRTLEERAVGGPPMWLPSVNSSRTQAIGWVGQLDISSTLPTLRSGALFLMDWASVDPFGAAAPTPTPEATPTPEPTDSPAPTAPPEETPAPTPTPEATDAQPSPEASTTTGQAEERNASSTPAATDPAVLTDEPTATDTPAATDAPTAEPTALPAPPAVQIPTPQAANPRGDNTGDETADQLVPLEPDRDPRAAPVVDWQASWSADGAVLGVWIADSAGSSWGRLAVYAIDQETQKVMRDDPLLSMTLARRGFSLGESRVAWVGPSEDNVDGELRIRTWGSDGVGGLRLKSPDQEEVVPAS